MKIEIRKAEVNDIYKLAELREPGASAAITLDAFDHSLDSWVGLIDEVPICVWGVITPNVLSDDVYVWMTGTKLIELHPLVFARWSHAALTTLAAYPKLHGLVLCDFELSKKWLKWLGFTVGLPEGKICKFSRGITEATNPA